MNGPEQCVEAIHAGGGSSSHARHRRVEVTHLSSSWAFDARHAAQQVAEETHASAQSAPRSSSHARHTSVEVAQLNWPTSSSWAFDALHAAQSSSRVVFHERCVEALHAADDASVAPVEARA